MVSVRKGRGSPFGQRSPSFQTETPPELISSGGHCSGQYAILLECILVIFEFDKRA